MILRCRDIGHLWHFRRGEVPWWWRWRAAWTSKEDGPQPGRPFFTSLHAQTRWRAIIVQSSLFNSRQATSVYCNHSTTNVSRAASSTRRSSIWRPLTKTRGETPGTNRKPCSSGSFWGKATLVGWHQHISTHTATTASVRCNWRSFSGEADLGGIYLHLSR